MLNKRFLAPLVLLALLPLQAFADSSELKIEQSAQQLCERVKYCALENVSINQMDDTSRLMLNTFLDGLCKERATPILSSLKSSKHAEGAQECVEDVLELECSELLNEQAKNIESCESVKKWAEENENVSIELFDDESAE